MREFNCRATDTISDLYQKTAAAVVFPTLVVGTILHTIVMASRVAQTTAYSGAWDLGVLVEGIDEAEVFPPGGRTFGNPGYYRGGDYRQNARVTGPEVTGAPLQALDRVAGRLLRALRMEHLDFTPALPPDVRPAPPGS